MDEPKLDPRRPREYHVLVEGQMHGPFTAESLKAALKSGDVTPEDLVQVGGLPIWRPLRQVLDSPHPRFESEVLPESVSLSAADPLGLNPPPPLPSPTPVEIEDEDEYEESEPPESVVLEDSSIPDWRALGSSAWSRLRSDFEERPVGTGLICIGAGIVACLASFWPFLFWLPWFGLAFFAGFDALKRGKTLQGVGLMVAACALPMALSTLISMLRPRPVESFGFPVDGSPEASSFAETVVAPTPAPVSKPNGSKGSSQPAIPVVIESVQPAKSAPSATPPPPPKSVAPPPPAPVATPAPTPRSSAVPIEPVKPVAMAPAPVATAPAPMVSASIQVVSPPPPAPVPSLRLSDLVPGDKISGGDLVQKHRDCFVVVQDGSASGSGFICGDGDKIWLFTNVHVAAGMRSPKFNRLDGSQLKVGAAEAGGNRDVIRFAVNDAAQPLDILPNLDANARIGDEVVVLGNSGGGGVVTALPGKLAGIGPDRIEVTAEFIPGNSGSPILHVPSGKVIGIATYLTKRYEEFAGGNTGTRTSDGATVRRFGYRLDQIRRWELVNWAVFHAEAEHLRQISALTADVFDFLDAVRERGEPQFATDTLRRPATEWLTGIRRQKVSEADRTRSTQNFLSSLRFMVRADVSAAENRIRYSYFRDRLQKEREVRDRLYKAFDEDVKKMVSPSLR